MPDEFDDIIDEIKKYFKIDSEIFDVDFLFIPESENSFNLKPKDNKVKGFKISYHFETGMERPEIRIKGNVDERQIRDYLKDVDISQYPSLKNLFDSSFTDEIDVSDLSLDISKQDNDLHVLDPHTEINNYEDYTEIVFDIPGMSEEDVTVNFREGGTEILFTAENNNRRYMKIVALPFKSSVKNYELEVKNGLAIINAKKSDN